MVVVFQNLERVSCHLDATFEAEPDNLVAVSITFYRYYTAFLAGKCIPLQTDVFVSRFHIFWQGRSFLLISIQ
jgi:hypothetical protein